MIQQSSSPKGGGGYSGFQVMGMIEWGQKSKESLGLPTKPKKIPGPKINPQKSHAELRGHYHESSDYLNTPKNPYLNQATQNNTCQIFLPKKILQSSPSLEIQSTPPGVKSSPRSSLFLNQ